MDSLTINKDRVVLTKDYIKQRLEQEIKEINDKYYKKLVGELKNSEGYYVRKMKQQLKEEHQMISEIASLYLQTLDYMQDAVIEVEKLDKKFSRRHILEGGK